MIEFPPEKVDRHTPEQLSEFAALYKKGEELYAAWNAYAGMLRLNEAYAVWMARSPGDRLSDQEIARYSNDVTYSKPSPEFIANPDLTGDVHNRILPTLARIIEGDNSVRSVLDVGVYNGWLDYYLARQYPHIRFIGVDFWKDLEQANAGMLPDNRTIITGYPLDIIEDRKADADLTFFFSTGVRIKNAELRRYLRSLRSKYVIFNEPNFPLPSGEILDPDQIDPKTSTPMIQYPVFSGDVAGGYPPALMHNFRAILAEEGYSVLHYESVHSPTPRVEVVASR
jgi:hypothetical protein